MKSNLNRRNSYAITSLAIIFLIIAFFCYYTPWFADDFCYGYAKYATVFELLDAEYKHYFVTNGRSLAHFYARILLRLDNMFYVGFQSLLFTTLVFLGFPLLFGRKWRSHFDWKNVLFLFCLIWLTMPAFGQAFLWRVGSANYTFTLCIAMIFILPYRMLIEKEEVKLKSWAQVLYVLGGVLAGWTNENLGALVVLLSFCAVGYAKYQKRDISVWAYLGVLSALIGWSFLILAPGNYCRIENEALPLLYKDSALRIIRATVRPHLFLLLEYVLMAVFIFSLLIKRTGDFKLHNTSNIWFVMYIASLLGLSAFYLSIFPPTRALTATSYLMMLATTGLYVIFAHYYKKTATLIIIALLCFTTCSIYENANIFIKSQPINEARLEMYQNSKGLSITVPNYKYANKYFFAGVSDVQQDPEHWKNKSVSRMYGLESVVLDSMPLQENGGSMHPFKLWLYTSLKRLLD